MYNFHLFGRQIGQILFDKFLIVHNNLKKKNVHLSGYVYELPLHKQPVFKKYNKLKLKNTEKYCKNHICLPLFYGMTIKQASFVVTQLKKLLQ